MCHHLQRYTPAKVICTLLFTLLSVGKADIVTSNDICQSINSADDTSSPPTDEPRHHFHRPQFNKRTPKAPIALSALRGPTSVSSAANHVLLVDLSALRHHTAISPAKVATPHDDYYSSSSSYDYNDSRSDPWEEALSSDDRPQRRHHSRHKDLEYRTNAIGPSDRLLVPFAAENTIGLHYNTFPLLEDILSLQSSHEDAFTDFIQEQLGDQDSKRSVFVSRSWLPGGHPKPRRKPSHRRKNVPSQGPPALPLIFSPKSWHPGGRKRNALNDFPWPKREIFFSRGWGPGGGPLRHPQKNPASDNVDSALETREQVPTASAFMSEVVEEKAHSRKRPRNHWGTPHLFGPYW